MLLDFFKKHDTNVNFDPVYIIEGQSNAVGSYTGAPSESYLLGPIPGVYIWFNNQWQLLQNGVNTQGYQTNDHGSELMLGYLAQKHFNKDVYIIKNSVGGTTINYFLNNTTYDTNENLAVNNLIATGKNPKVVAIHWNQGEADSGNLTNTYATELRSLVNQKRTNIARCSNAKLITCRVSSQLSTFPDPYHIGYLTVRAAQELVGNDINCAWYNQDDIPFNNGVHFGSEGQNTIGQRVFYLSINNSHNYN
jgi:hypothetical protein